jgi:hypothetical protein
VNSRAYRDVRHPKRDPHLREEAQSPSSPLDQRFLGSNHIGRVPKFVKPSVDDRMSVDVVDAGHGALPEFLL